MFANFCLPKLKADVFLEKLSNGEIDPDKLTNMPSSEARRAFFEDFMSKEEAKSVNTLFESKLLLKNQQAGLIRWAKQVAGITQRVRNELVDRAMNLHEALTPENEQAFLADFVEKKLGVGVSIEEANKIAELSQKVAQEQVKGKTNIEYGRAKVEFKNYVNDLKVEANKGYHGIGETLSEVSGTAKAVKASFDNSAIFRQGWKTLMTHPGTWLKNAKSSFVDMVRTVGGKNVMDEIQADIYSRENYDLYQKAKLAVGTTEEAYPTHFPEKIPGIGRLYKASETAYTGFLHKMRADVFDQYVKIAEKSGVDITDKAQIESIGKMVNSLTGRGNLGALEPIANTVNNVFFSPRNLKSNIDVLTAHQFEKGVTSFVRKQAALNLAKIVAGTAGVLIIANAVAPGSVEWDPRSSDFGKIKIGGTRFDVSGGMSSIVTLAARLATWESKNPSTGKITELNSGKFGSRTVSDVIEDFGANKLSPAARVFYETMISGKTFEGEKPTVSNQLQSFALPLPYTNYEELKNNPDSANILAAMIADALGISTNTYSK